MNRAWGAYTRISVQEMWSECFERVSSPTSRYASMDIDLARNFYRDQATEILPLIPAEGFRDYEEDSVLMGYIAGDHEVMIEESERNDTPRSILSRVIMTQPGAEALQEYLTQQLVQS